VQEDIDIPPSGEPFRWLDDTALHVDDEGGGWHRVETTSRAP